MPFTFKKTPLEGVLIIQPRIFADTRGFFMESYKRSDFVSAGISEEFVQDNHSLSSKGLPVTVNEDDYMYRIYVIDKINKGKEAVLKGNFITSQELRENGLGIQAGV